MVHQGTNFMLNIISAPIWCFISGVFVFARFITRLTLRADRLGWDDWTLVVGWTFFALNFIFYAFSMASLFQGWDLMSIMMDIDEFHYTETLHGICILFGFISNGFVKLSMAIFLIRLTPVLWHRILLWFLGITWLLYSLSVGSIFMYCQYSRASPILQPPGTEGLNGTDIPFAETCTWGALVNSRAFWIWSVLWDFFLAGFPTYMLWNIRMRRSKKLVICISLGLGVISGALGIERLIVYVNIYTANDIVWVYFWGMAEESINIICVCIPALLPLWNKVFKKKHAGGITHNRDRGNTIGGGIEGGQARQRKRGSGAVYDPRFDSLLAETVPTQNNTVNGDGAMTTRGDRSVMATGRGMETVNEKSGLGSTTTNTTSSGIGSGGGGNDSQSGDSVLDTVKEGGPTVSTHEKAG